MKTNSANRLHTPVVADDRNTLAAVAQARVGVLSEAELFAMLRITVASGRQRAYRGTLPPHYKVGRQKFYAIEDVQAWMRSHRVDSAA